MIDYMTHANVQHVLIMINNYKNTGMVLPIRIIKEVYVIMFRQ